MAKSGPTNGKSPAELIDDRIASFDDWRGKTLAALRAVITGADKGVVEEWKWGGPVWSCHGIICTGETYKSVVKLTFAKGASLPDPATLFNSSLEGATRRAIDVREGEAVNVKALHALVRAAVAFNVASTTGKGAAKHRANAPARAAKAPARTAKATARRARARSR